MPLRRASASAISTPAVPRYRSSVAGAPAARVSGHVAPPSAGTAAPVTQRSASLPASNALITAPFSRPVRAGGKFAESAAKPSGYLPGQCILRLSSCGRACHAQIAGGIEGHQVITVSRISLEPGAGIGSYAAFYRRDQRTAPVDLVAGDADVVRGGRPFQRNAGSGRRQGEVSRRRSRTGRGPLRRRAGAGGAALTWPIRLPGPATPAGRGRKSGTSCR